MCCCVIDLYFLLKETARPPSLEFLVHVFRGVSSFASCVGVLLCFLCFSGTLSEVKSTN